METSNSNDNIEMFGCTIEEINKSFNSFSSIGLASAGKIHIITILSDAQELLDIGEKERARQYINRARYLIMNKLS